MNHSANYFLVFAAGGVPVKRLLSSRLLRYRLDHNRSYNVLQKLLWKLFYHSVNEKMHVYQFWTPNIVYFDCELKNCKWLKDHSERESFKSVVASLKLTFSTLISIFLYQSVCILN